MSPQATIKNDFADPLAPTVDVHALVETEPGRGGTPGCGEHEQQPVSARCRPAGADRALTGAVQDEASRSASFASELCPDPLHRGCQTQALSGWATEDCANVVRVDEAHITW